MKRGIRAHSGLRSEDMFGVGSRGESFGQSFILVSYTYVAD
jgi:hypothetical protein